MSRGGVRCTVKVLKPDHMASIVVGNVRDTSGCLHGLNSDTQTALRQAGCQLYNEAILMTALGNAPLRASHTMSAASKLVMTHQYVVVVVKGSSFTPALARRIGIRANEDDVPAPGDGE